MIMKAEAAAYPFTQLVSDLSDALGPSSGIDSDDIDPNDLHALMAKYYSQASEWQQYALSDPSRNYTRNLVDKGNGKSNLLILVWNPGKASPIHDHANAHCVMKILQGSLQETLYSRPAAAASAATTPCALQITRETTYVENDVTYISDHIGLHKITNPSDTQPAVSLHLYTPPHAATYGFNLFNEKTGSVTHIKQARVFSDHGKIVDGTAGGCF